MNGFGIRHGLGLAAGIAVLVGVSGCVITPDGIEDKEVLVPDIFPPSKTVASYRRSEKVSRADREVLTKQLGGKHKFGILKKWGTFSSMYADYGLPKKPPKVRVTVTEMTNRLRAYGAYTNLRPGLLKRKQYVKIGIHGTIDGARLLFVQDMYLIVVRDLSRSTADQRRSLLINFGRRISSRIPRPIGDVDVISFLPFQNRVLASERLDQDDPLGLDILKGGAVTALYRNKEGREAKVFLARVTGTLMRRSAMAR